MFDIFCDRNHVTKFVLYLTEEGGCYSPVAPNVELHWNVGSTYNQKKPIGELYNMVRIIFETQVSEVGKSEK